MSITKRSKTVCAALLVLLLLTGVCLALIPGGASAAEVTTKIADFNYHGTTNYLYSELNMYSDSISSNPLTVSANNFRLNYRTTKIDHNWFVTIKVNLIFTLFYNGKELEPKKYVNFERGGMDYTPYEADLFTQKDLRGTGDYVLMIGGSISCVNNVPFSQTINIKVI